MNHESKYTSDRLARRRTQYEVMRTGELARRAGVNIETLRFYERQKLLREPSRTAGGYRDYTRTRPGDGLLHPAVSTSRFHTEGNWTTGTVASGVSRGLLSPENRRWPRWRSFCACRRAPEHHRPENQGVAERCAPSCRGWPGNWGKQKGWYARLRANEPDSPAVRPKRSIRT